MATVKVHHDGLDFKALVTISKGCAATGPTYSCGGTPAEPAECVVLRLWVCSDGGKEYDMDSDEIDEDLFLAIEEVAVDDCAESEACAMEEAAERGADARREGD